MPISLADLLKLRSTEHDGAFEAGFKAAAERKQLEQTAALKEAAAKAEQERQMKSLADLQKSYPQAQSYKAGDLSVSQGSKMDNLLEMLRYQALQEERKNRAVERLGGAYTKAKLPEMTQFSQEAEKELTPEKIKGAYGGVLGSAAQMPLIGRPVQALQEYLNPEAARTRAVMEQLKAFPRHELFGATLTGQEKEAAELAFGGGLTKRPEMVKYAVDALKKATERKKKAVEGAFPKDVREAYAQESGNVEMPVAPSKPVMSFEEWKKAKKEGKL